MPGKKSKRGPFEAGEPLRGLGEVTGAADRYVVKPTAQEIFEETGRPGAGPHPVMQFGEPGDPKMRLTSSQKRRIVDSDTIQAFLAVPPVVRQVRYTIHALGTAPLRLDVPLRNRIDCLIWNLSDTQVLWVNDSQAVGVGAGVPLAPNSAVAAYDGASLAINAGWEIEFWGVMAAGANHLVICIETAR